MAVIPQRTQTGAGTNREWLDADTLRRLARRLAAGLKRARGTGGVTLVSVSGRCQRADDPSAVVAASRGVGEQWFCIEQPDRDGCALAALGCVRSLQARGPERFAAIEQAWRGLVARSLADTPDGPPGCGLAAVGGFAFAPDGGQGPRWQGFAPASLVVPEVSFARRAGESWLTVNVQVAPDDTLAQLSDRVDARLDGLRDAPLPLLDPAPTGKYAVLSPMPPSHYEEAVARAVQRIRGGELEKIVLAREVEVRAPRPHDPAAVVGVLREAFRSCYVFAVGRGEATFVAASPELLARREGQRASTVALAGSIRRSADPAVDDHLAEQLLHSAKDRAEHAVVIRRIDRTLRPHSLWVAHPPEPEVVQIANIQHLAAPVRAQLAQPLGAIQLAGLLHPTPAVGAEPGDAAQTLIPALEGLDRGWYAGPVGWTDSSGDGEFCVALRCALLRDTVATCYAGCGIVADSDPAAELAETEIKLGALLPVLSG